MLPFLRRQRARPADWLAVAVHADRIDLAQVEAGAVARCESHAFDDSAAEALARVRRQLGGHRFRCSNLLAPGGYQMQMTEAPAVPPAEMREAVRWKLRDLLDYPVDQATVDLVQVPPATQDSGRAQHVFAVSARNSDVAARMRLFHDAKFPLHAIDVPEMAQRNVAALFEQPGRGLALLSMSADSALLTVSRDGELFLARRTEIGANLLREAPAEAREQALDRLVLELQRTLDHFDRQFGHVAVSHLLVSPLPVLLAHLQANLDLPVQPLELGATLDLGAVPELADPARQCAFLHLIGAAMRAEAAT